MADPVSEKAAFYSTAAPHKLPPLYVSFRSGMAPPGTISVACSAGVEVASQLVHSLEGDLEDDLHHVAHDSPVQSVVTAVNLMHCQLAHVEFHKSSSSTS